jgi:hypothetical protein
LKELMKGWRIVILGLAALAVVDCTREEAPPEPVEDVPFVSPAEGMGAGTPAISAGAPVELSETLRSRWSAVQLTIGDKRNDTSEEFTVDLRGELAIPDSGLRIRVMEFLPDLKIEGNKFISSSSDLLNPAVHVMIYENEKEIFDGWLFQLFPSVHPFEHDRFTVVLKAPVLNSS